MSNILYNSYIYFMKLKDATDDINKMKTEKVNFIGVYDENQQIWYNGWTICDIEHYDKYKLSKELLIYGLNIERDMGKSHVEKAIIKSILVNSKFYISNKNLQLNVIVALISYLVKAKSYSIFKVGSLSIYSIEISDNRINNVKLLDFFK